MFYKNDFIKFNLCFYLKIIKNLLTFKYTSYYLLTQQNKKLLESSKHFKLKVCKN